MKTESKLVYGWGVNDSDYVTQHCHEVSRLDGIRVRRLLWACPYYKDWIKMIQRCFSETFHGVQPTYVGCTICEEWKYFSNFIKWVDSQPNRDWENCELDKDLLSDGGKYYGPDTCVYIPKGLNNFITDRTRNRGNLSIGVVKWERNKKNSYMSQCNDPFKGKNTRFLGYYPTELGAHKAWQAKKHEYACILAEQQQDPRVAKALRERYAPDKDWTNK